MRILVVLIGLLAALYLAAAGAMYALQRDLLFLPTNRAPLPSDAGFLGATEYALAATDGTRILLWYAPAPPGGATILYLQGNAGEIADRPKRWAAYRAAGYGVAYLSYRGYGGSEGEPSEDGLHLDADAAYDWLLMRGLAPQDLVVVGESLGTGVAVRLAADRDIAALVLEAPYTSAADVAAKAYPWLPVRLLMKDPFPSIDRIAGVTAPMLILHGEDDQTIPFAFGQALFDAAPGPKEFLALPGKGHEALYDPDTWAAEIAFLSRVLSRP